MSADILQVLLLLRNQVKVYHWQTFQYGRHKASDDLVASLDTNIDKFTEVYMGKYGRPHFKKKHSFSLFDSTDAKAHKLLDEGAKWLVNELPKHLSKTDTDLLNIRDEIVGDLHQASYLFTLK